MTDNDNKEKENGEKVGPRVIRLTVETPQIEQAILRANLLTQLVFQTIQI